MQAIIKKTKGSVVSETVIESVIIMRHGISYGSDGNYEYLELWTNSLRPEITVRLDGYTEVIMR